MHALDATTTSIGVRRAFLSCREWMCKHSALAALAQQSLPLLACKHETLVHPHTSPPTHLERHPGMASASNSSKGSKADKASKKRKATTDTPTAAVEGVQVDDDLDTENVDMVDTNEDDASEGRSASKKSKKVKRSEEATSAATGGERSDGEEGGGEEEVQVLSHAEQRKRRKLEKKRAKDPNYSKPESEEAREGAAASSRNEASGSQEGTADTKDPTATTPAERPAPRGRFGVWVGNLSFKTDADKVKSFWRYESARARIALTCSSCVYPNHSRNSR